MFSLSRSSERVAWLVTITGRLCGTAGLAVLQSTFFLERLPASGAWGYYGLWGIRTNALTSGHEASSINRAVAMFRHLAGIPTDQEPPAVR